MFATLADHHKTCLFQLTDPLQAASQFFADRPQRQTLPTLADDVPAASVGQLHDLGLRH